MDKATFRSLQVGDVIEGRGLWASSFGVVTVKSIQEETRWAEIHEARARGEDPEVADYTGTWAVETDPYQYVKEGDRVVRHLHLLRRGSGR